MSLHHNEPGHPPQMRLQPHPNNNQQPPPPPQQQQQQQHQKQQQSQQKRPVARHACLACREKKIKCDGEVSLSQSDKPEVNRQQCSNCKLLGLECIFVKSQRGGRRKRDDSHSERSTGRGNNHHGATIDISTRTGASTPTTSRSFATEPDPSNTNTNNTAVMTSPGALGSFASMRNPLNTPPPPSIAATSPFFHPGRHSPSIATSRDRGSSTSAGSLQEKVHQLQKEAASLQSQLMDRNGSITSSSTQSQDYFPRRDYHDGPHPMRGPPPPGGPPGGPHGPDYGPWGLGGGRHHPGPHRHHFGPRDHHHHHGPPPPWANGGGPPFGHHGPPLRPSLGGPLSSSGFSGGPPPPPPMHPHGGPPPPPPPPPPSSQSMPMHPAPGPVHPHSATTFPFSSFDDEHSRKRLHSAQDSDFNLPKLAPSLGYVSIPDSELDMFDLPDWKTTCILIDLYYRYIHPSRPFLPPKHRLIYQLQVRQDASLIHAMFSSACRFASSMTIPNPNLRDPQHWYFLAEKYWDYMDAETALQALVLLMGALGPHGFVQQSIEGSERIYQVMKISYLLDARYISDWSAFASVATKKQVLRHEDTLRTIWGSWKLNVFLRLNRGAPYNKISDKLLPFPHDLPLPLSDSQYNLNMGIFDTTDNHCLQSLRYRNWPDLERELNNASVSSSEYQNMTDSDLIIAAIKQVEDIMDIISAGCLTSNVVNQFTAKIKVIEDLANSSLYQISHIKKKTAVLNISRLFAILMLDIAKLTSNASQCLPILFIKPHETQSNKNPDDVMNSLYRSKLEDIHAECLKLTDSQIIHYIQSFMAALDVVRLVEMGMGRIPEAATSISPITVVGGPLNFTAASEISSLKSNESWWTDAIPEPGKTMSAHVETYNEFPDVWLQYPIFSVVVIANALTMLASSIILTKLISVRELPPTPDLQHGTTNVQFTVGDGQHTVRTVLEKEVFDGFVAAFNPIDLHEKIALCGKYIKTHGRFWPYVESISHQVDAMINYVDDITQRN